MHTRPMTREDALQRLTAFAPNMGGKYTKGRNSDHGAGHHTAVSTLSPDLRRRLITEPEVIATALRHHSASSAEKFIQEVVWRSYFKGWLERRQGIWQSYLTGLNADLKNLSQNPDLAAQIDAAERGETGLDCMDAWAAELTETGYLHNHARMWFASIWIFTFGLPWRLGADFFHRHLLDGDPASNTLGWRWVAGLHTQGRTYLAKSWNIAKYTDGRFTPHERDLAADAPSLHEAEEPNGLPNVTPLREITAPDPSKPTALLITTEDCLPEDFPLNTLDIRATAMLEASHLRSPRPVSPHVTTADQRALADAASRSGQTTETLTAQDSATLTTWAADHNVTQIATPYIPEGPLRDWINSATPHLRTKGITLTEWRRDWDTLVWPHATAGFFKVKKKIPQFIDAAGLDGQPRLL